MSSDPIVVEVAPEVAASDGHERDFALSGRGEMDERAERKWVLFGRREEEREGGGEPKEEATAKGGDPKRWALFGRSKA